MAYLGQTQTAPAPSINTAAINTAFNQINQDNWEGASASLGSAGLSVTTMIDPALASNPLTGVIAGVLAVASVISNFIGTGRKEADVIVPVQNQLVNPQHTGTLDQITNILVSGMTSPLPVATLQQCYEAVQQLAVRFVAFVSSPQFKDGRASAQALNTIMPYIDGSCGYVWPPPMHPSQQGCLVWGAGTPGGPGNNGMLGAIARALEAEGGALPPPMLTQGGGSSIGTLAVPGTTVPLIPQAGTLPGFTTGTVPSFLSSPGGYSSVISVSAGGSSLMLAALAVGAFLVLRRV